jgi:hypothetical protein
MVCSVGLVFYNKWVIFTLGFNFPAFLTFIQSCTTSALLHIAFDRLELWPSPYGVLPVGSIIKGVLPIAILLSAGVVLRNAVFAHLSVAAIQMLAACAPAVVYLLSYLAALERPTYRVTGTLVCICCGVLLSSQGAVKASARGVILQLAGITCEAMREVVTKRFFSVEPSISPVSMLYLVVPMSALVLFIPAAFELERVVIFMRQGGNGQHWFVILVLLGNGALAGLLNFSALRFLERTSALTKSVSAVLKDIAIISIGLHFLNAPSVGNVGLLGWALSLAGLVAYAYVRSAPAAAPPLPVLHSPPSSSSSLAKVPP